jgi:DNA repair protein RadC
MATGRRERIVNRVNEFGLTALTDYEKAEFLLYPFIPRKDTNGLAHKLIDRFKTIEGLLSASKEDVLTVEGVPPKFAEFITTIIDNVKAIFKGSVSQTGLYTRAEVKSYIEDNVNPSSVSMLQLSGDMKPTYLEELPKINAPFHNVHEIFDHIIDNLKTGIRIVVIFNSGITEAEFYEKYGIVLASLGISVYFI